jgi:hypothetical protein
MIIGLWQLYRENNGTVAVYQMVMGFGQLCHDDNWTVAIEKW